MSRMFNLKELLEGKQSVALGGHVRPDGDCVGSTMGLYLYLKENFPQIETDLYLESVPEAYSMIRHTDEVKSELPEGKIYDLFICMDCGDLQRLGFSQKKRKSMIFLSPVMSAHWTDLQLPGNILMQQKRQPALTIM